MFGTTGDEAILDEVHGWLGLSLDFLQKHSPASLPSITDSSGSPASSPENAESSEPIIYESDTMPVEDFDVPDWDDGTTKCDYGILGSPSTQFPGQNTVAFQSLSCYGIDSPIGLLELSHGIILGPFLEDLKIIYFKNVHPYYPVVDEYGFDQDFFRVLDNDVLRKSRALVLSAMLLCSSMYLNSRQLYGFGKWTQQSLQHSLFLTVKELYDSLQDGDQYCLTQACILLSYWGPAYPPAAQHVCSEWLSKAFEHAKRAGLDQATSEVLTDRSHLIWCCCIVRDRILSFNSRQPLSPHSTLETRVQVEREDFGLELPLPRYTNSMARSKVVESFVMMCQLSETLAGIIHFEGEQKKKLSEKKTGDITRKDVLRVSQLDIQLREWKRGFKISQPEPRCTPDIDSKGSYYLRNILAESATVTLYLPFVTLTSHSDKMVNHFAKTALQKVKDATMKVADTIKELLDTVRPEEMPPFVSLWLPLPILTLLISLKYNHRKDSACNTISPSHTSQSSGTSSPYATSAPPENSDITRLRHLFSALKVFRTRFRSGQFILDLVTQVARELHLGLWHLDGRPVFEVLDPETPGRRRGETETLRKAAEMIEWGIRRDKSGNSDR